MTNVPFKSVLPFIINAYLTGNSLIFMTDDRLTPKAFLTKNLKRGRKQLYRELQKSGNRSPEDAVIRSESMIYLTEEQLATSEGKHPDEFD